jgi:hypothetical protein
MVGEPDGAICYLPAQGVPWSPLLNRQAVHFSKIPNKPISQQKGQSLGTTFHLAEDKIVAGAMRPRN